MPGRAPGGHFEDTEELRDSFYRRRLFQLKIQKLEKPKWGRDWVGYIPGRDVYLNSKVTGDSLLEEELYTL